MVQKVGELTWFERMTKEFENDPEYLREYISLCSDEIKCQEEKIAALERERDELQAKVIEQDDKLYKAEKRLEVACHVKADDKVGFDFAILDKMDALERERDELKEELRKWRDSRDGMMSIVEKLEADNALLRKRLEPIEAAHREYEEYPSSAIVKRDAYDKAINRCMELEEG